MYNKKFGKKRIRKNKIMVQARLYTASKITDSLKQCNNPKL